MEKHMHSSWSLLPHDLLWLIIQRLDAVDCHCLSAVCKNYRLSCKYDNSRFLIPNDPVPWLSIRKTTENSLVELYRPLTNKTYTMNVPQIQDTECYYAKGGWLLLREHDHCHNLFLFNIFSMQKVDLPSLNVKIQWGHKVTFSTHQKQPSRVIVIIHGGVNFSSIYAWTKGATTWKRRDFGWGVESILCTWLSGNILYCFTANREVYKFDKDLDLKRTRSLNKILKDSGIYFKAMDVTSNIALCNNNELYFYLEGVGVYKFDCSAMDWTNIDGRNSIWFFNKRGTGGSGTVIKGSLSNTESLLNDLIVKGCKIYTTAFSRGKGFFPMLVDNGDDNGEVTRTNEGIFRVIGIKAEDCIDWNWINLQ